MMRFNSGVKDILRIVSDNIRCFGFLPLKLSLAGFVIFLFNFSAVTAQTGYGVITGVVSDSAGNRLPNANVLLKENNLGIATDNDGYYRIATYPGTYTIEVSYVGYEKAVQKLKILKDRILNINFTLKSTSFQIGGIEVIGRRDLLPDDISTKTVIESGEIEHYQASSVKDVLDLVPGVQKSDNPGLNKTTQAAVRGSEADQLSAFGTAVIIDGTPVSNNANLQFEKLTGSKFGGSNVGGGVDLRTIPADNLETVEVITGLPSVRYGEFTSGIINIKTKKGAAPHRLKIKNNPDTREGNIGGGFLAGEGSINYNLNLAQSERDIRKTGDEYLRLTGQVIHSADYFYNKLTMDNKFSFQAIYDEEEPKGDLQRIKNYNRGFTLGYANSGTYNIDESVSIIDYNAFVTMRRENSMRSRLVQSDLRILPNNDTVSVYNGQVNTKGIEWTVGGRLEWNRVFFTGNYIHRLLIGTNPQYNANTGEGVLIDSVFNYYGAESGVRSYEFDDIPGQFLTNFYIEDKITGHFLLDFNLVLGFRYDLYQPEKLNLSGFWGDGDLIESKQGSFFNPRLNLKLYLSQDSQIRISAGTSSKSPAMSVLYPPETVFKWRNPVDSTTNFFRYDRHVPNLKGYKETHYEISYDHRFFRKIGTTFSAYYKTRNNEPERETVPVFFTQSVGNNNYVYYIDSYNLSTNAGFTESKGLEFAIRTHKIRPLNMEFQIVGAYNFLKYDTGINYYDNAPDASLGQYPNYQVPGTTVDTLLGMWYPSGESWNDRFQLNYYIKYTSPTLGLWVTLRAEQLVWEKSQNFNQQPVEISVLNETQLTNYYFSRRIITKPNKWLLSLSISKSLFPGSEVSFYVNNFLDDPAIRRYNSSPTRISEEIRNPDLYYGIEFSMILDKILGGKE